MAPRIVGFLIGLFGAAFVAYITVIVILGYSFGTGAPLWFLSVTSHGVVALVAYLVLLFWCVAFAQLLRFFPGSLTAVSIASFILILITIYMGGLRTVVLTVSFAATGGLSAVLIFFGGKSILNLIGYVGGAFPIGEELFWRGVNIGVNCLYAGIVADIVYGAMFTPIGGGVAAVLVLIASFAVLIWPEDAGVKLVVGTLAPLLPSSWLFTVIGGVFFLIGLALHWVSLVFAGAPAFARWFAVGAVTISPEESSIAIAGGLPANLNGAVLVVSGPMGYDLGLFLMLHGFFGTPPGLIQHEAGHHLNLAAFGSLFQLIGWFDEIRAAAVAAAGGPGGGIYAYAERLAEGNVVGTTRPIVRMWR